MFDSLKKKRKMRKIDMELKQNLKDLKQDLLTIKIPEKASKAQLDQFEKQMNMWKDILTEKGKQFAVVVNHFSTEDKLELIYSLNTCMDNYGYNIINLNNILIEYLANDKLSEETKIAIATFGKQNISKADENLFTIKAMVKQLSIKGSTNE